MHVHINGGSTRKAAFSLFGGTGKVLLIVVLGNRFVLSVKKFLLRKVFGCILS
jgi:hypothetical protein